MVRKLNEIHAGDWKHNLSSDPTEYERYLNYAESLVHACDLVREEADILLMHIEENAEFYTDERNSKFFGYDEKMDKIGRFISQLEKIRNQIRKID